MLQVIYMMFLKHYNKKDPELEQKIRIEAAKEYQMLFKGTKVSYMERLFNRVQ